VQANWQKHSFEKAQEAHS